MDPISVIGIIGSTVSVADIIAKSLKGLHNLKAIYKAADLSIRIVETQLGAVKAALDQLREWMTKLQDASEYGPLLEQIDLAVECCEIIVATLHESVDSLHRNTQNSLTPKGELGYMLGEGFIKQMRSDLTDLVGSLTLLLSTSQLKTKAERSSKLQNEESQSLFQQIRDDASSYQRPDSESGSIRTRQSKSSQDSKRLDENFEFDPLLFDSQVYRTAMRDMLGHVRAGAFIPPRAGSAGQSQRLFSIAEDPAGVGRHATSDTTASRSQSTKSVSDGGSHAELITEPQSPKGWAKIAAEMPSLAIPAAKPQPMITDSKSRVQRDRASDVRTRGIRFLSRLLQTQSATHIHESRELNIEIEKSIREWKFRSDRRSRVLLLGTGDSGKSTLMKDLEFNFQQGRQESTLDWKENIWENTINSMIAVLDAMDSFGLQLDGERSEKAARLIRHQAFQNRSLRTGVLVSMVRLRDDSGVQQCMRRASEFQLDAAAPFWFLNAERTLHAEYLPTNADVLRTRRRTTGIHETDLQVGDRIFEIFDTGGERAERKKWIHCFQKVDVLVFIVDYLSYDQVLYEDETVNRMQEALTLFESIVNSRWFTKTHVILVFNKSDRLWDKLSKVPLKTYFPDYQGQSFEEAKAYLEARFTTLAKDNLFEAFRPSGPPPARTARVLHCSFFEGKNVAWAIGQNLIELSRLSEIRDNANDIEPLPPPP